MNRLYTIITLSLSLLTGGTANASGIWQQITKNDAPTQPQLLQPKQYTLYTADAAALKLQLTTLSGDPQSGAVIALPLPNGTMREFKVWQTPMLPNELAAKCPGIQTFTAEAIDDKRVTAKLDITPLGFHAMIYDSDNTAFVDPYDATDDGYYLVHYKKDEYRAPEAQMKCGVDGAIASRPQAAGNPFAARTVNGYQLRTYRLALSANHFYCQAAPYTTSVTLALSKMTTTMNRVNGVYERELAITMVFVANEDQLIWPLATGGTTGDDPFASINDNAAQCLVQNQTSCDAIIGSANYDIGHVFTTGAGGLALLGIVCQDSFKAQGVTGSAAPRGDGFDIDYVAHEMGHEFGADHTFNDSSNGTCAGNAVVAYSFEPGSGSTIMAYAGICTNDNVQAHSDAYFHSVSLEQIYEYAMIGPGNSCAVKTATDNKQAGFSPYASSFTIPYLTPFELTAPVAVDSSQDSVILYGWEQVDTGGSDFGKTFAATQYEGPIFRSFPPTQANIRVFPTIDMVLAGKLSNVGDTAQGEKVPEVPRAMHFRCTYRAIKNNKGVFTIPDDIVTLNAVVTGTGTGFKVTSQGNAGIAYSGGSTQNIAWTVLNTNTAPINASTVKIYMSIDGGHNWHYLVGVFPNTGSATVIMPNPASSSNKVRFKVKGGGNVFFNVNGSDFTVQNNPDVPVTPINIDSAAAVGVAINIYPIPAKNVLHVKTDFSWNMAVYNAIGQRMWTAQVTGDTDINTATWARGCYFMVAIDGTGRKITRRLVFD
jgi:hypothetical protein